MENKVSREVKDLEDSINNLDKEIEEVTSSSINSSNVIDIINEDIEKIDIKVRKIDLNNIKKAIIRKIKIAGNYFLHALPYIIIPTITFLISFYLIHDIPFYRQPEKHYAIHESVITQDGITDNVIEYKAKNFIDKDSFKMKGYYKSPWVKRADGYYHRSISEYGTSVYTVDFLQKVIDNPNLSLKDHLYNVKNVTKEVKKPSEITLEEINKDGEASFVYHYSDDTDFIIEAQASNINIIETSMFIAFVLMIYILYPYSDKHLDRIRKINKKYKKEDIEELKKLLKENKIKFEVVKNNRVSMIDPITSEKTFIKQI